MKDKKMELINLITLPKKLLVKSFQNNDKV